MSIHRIVTKRTEEGFESGYEQVNVEEPTTSDYLNARDVVADNERLLSILREYDIRKVVAVNKKVLEIEDGN